MNAATSDWPPAQKDMSVSVFAVMIPIGVVVTKPATNSQRVTTLVLPIREPKATQSLCQTNMREHKQNIKNAQAL